MGEETPKIIIDEDWKAQVQREKANVAEEKTEQREAGEGGVEQEESASPFISLVDFLSMQVLVSLGVEPLPGSEEHVLDLDAAKFFLDMLLSLRDKTKGNLEAEEEGFLTHMVSELQSLHIQAVQEVQQYIMQQGGKHKGRH